MDVFVVWKIQFVVGLRRDVLAKLAGKIGQANDKRPVLENANDVSIFVTQH